MRRPPLPLLLLLPSVVTLSILFVYPLCLTGVNSLGLRAGGGSAGVGSYLDLLQEASIRQSLAMTLYYAVAPVLLALAIAVPFAAMLTNSFIGRRLFLSLYKIPAAMPAVVVAAMAVAWIEPGGLVSRPLALLGLPMPRIIRDPFAIGAVLTMAWKTVPFMTFLISAALQGVSQDLKDAARAYGAGRVRTLLLIQVPLALPGISAAVTLALIGSVGAFAVPNLLGPGYPQPLSVLMYRAYLNGDWARVDVLGMTISVVIILLLLAYHGLNMLVGVGGHSGRKR